MTEGKWRIPPSVLRLLERAPDDRAVVVLLRHSVRDHLPEGDAGYVLPITDMGRQLALELGGLLRGRLRTLHASPLVRCVQTAQALAEGVGADVSVIPNQLLGDPGVFVLDGRRAWANWKQLGHEGVMRHLVTEAVALSGMARPDEAGQPNVEAGEYAAIEGAKAVSPFFGDDFFFDAIPLEGAITIVGVLLPYVKQVTQPTLANPIVQPSPGYIGGPFNGRADPFGYLMGPDPAVDPAPITDQVGGLTFNNVRTIIDQVVLSATKGLEPESFHTVTALLRAETCALKLGALSAAMHSVR